jgi:hypothetical protein
MRKILLALSFVFALVPFTNAQQFNCGTDEMHRAAIARNPFLIEAKRQNELLLNEKIVEMRQNRDGENEMVYVIPVVWHILHLEGPENISDAQIWDAMFVLNRDYAKLNSDTIQVVSGFDTIIANVKVEFRLATKDFLGNCTNGIERIKTTEANQGNNGSKVNLWPRERYLNIWTSAKIGVSGAAGYSQNPPDVIDQFGARADGVILLHDYIGRIGTGSEYRSRALTHEVGHWLNLSHTWGDTNDPEVACGTDGDGVADTPITAGHDNCSTLYDFECNRQGLNLSSLSPNIVSILTFDSLNTTDGTSDVTPLPEVIYSADGLERLSYSAFEANGVSPNPTADSLFSYSNWTSGSESADTNITQMSGSINNNDYYEFTITPGPGSLMTLTGLALDFKRTDTGPRCFALRTSLNGYSTNMTVVDTTASNPRLTSNPHGGGPNYYSLNRDLTTTQLGARWVFPTSGTFIAINEPVSFRLYAWNAEDASGSFAVDNVRLSGSFGVNENIQNYMEYSYCTHMFTEGQKERMRATLELAISGRNNLWTDANRALTGTDDNPLTCAPIADFYPENKFVCLGDETIMRDNSTNGVVDSWLWTFEDGNPATSTEQYPTVSFNEYGRKTITLTVGNEEGSNSKTIYDCVVVAPEGTQMAGGLLQDGFESQEEFYLHWTPLNYDNNTSNWHQVNNAGLSNNTSAMLNAYEMNGSTIDEGGFDIDALVSPVYDLSFVQPNAYVTFDYAFATQSIDLAGITDSLVVEVSRDCGKTWPAFSNPVLEVKTDTIVTAGNVLIPFAPTNANDWHQAKFKIPNSYLGPGFRMRFIFYAGEFPNNLYIDNINLEAVVSVPELNADFYGASLFPNPSENSTTLSYMNPTGSNVEITLADMSGRVVQRYTPNNRTPGVQTLNIQTGDLAKGLYLVNMNSDQNTATLKLMVK